MMGSSQPRSVRFPAWVLKEARALGINVSEVAIDAVTKAILTRRDRCPVCDARKEMEGSTRFCRDERTRLRKKRATVE